MRLVFIAYLILILLHGNSQNLVPNPSFEEYDTCPDNLSQLDRAKHWFYISDGTSDYYNACETIVPNSVSIPTNVMGYQPAHSGLAYAGIFFTAGDTIIGGSHFQRIEYLATKLVEKMENKLYRVIFHISLADSIIGLSTGKHVAGSGINIFNCHFTSDITYESTLGILSIESNYEVNTGTPVTDSLGWTKIEGYYYAAGTENYLIIGQTNKNFASYITNRAFNVINYKAMISYYYYDDIEITPISDNEFPNIFTPNGDGINDEFDLKISCIDCGLQLQIFNRWGQLLTTTHSFKWDGTHNGTPCADGVYYYVLNDTVNKKSVYSGFFQLQKN